MLGVACQFNNEDCQMGCACSKTAVKYVFRRYLTSIMLWHHPSCFVQSFELNIGAIHEAYN